VDAVDLVEASGALTEDSILPPAAAFAGIAAFVSAAFSELR